MELTNVQILRETAKARLCRWYDVDHHTWIKTWVPKRVSELHYSSMTIYSGFYKQILQREFLKNVKIMPKDKTLQVLESKVKYAAERWPESKEALQAILPEAFKDERIFCKVGDILKCDGVPYVYSVQRDGNEFVYLHNISTSSPWALRITADHDITVAQFKRLIADTGRAIDKWGVVEKYRL